MDSNFLAKVAKDEYRLSYSSLKQLLETPRHFYNYFTQPRKESEAMQLGTLVHCLVLEPAQFENRYFVADKPDQRTKVGKAEWAEILAANDEKIVIPTETFNQAETMAKAVFEHEEAHLFEDVAEFEKPFQFEYRGLQLQGITDGIGERLILDLKTTANAKPKKFRYSFLDFYYHVQAALYCLANPNREYIIFAVDASGYVSVSRVGEQSLALGKMLLDQAINTYEACKMFDGWMNGYSGISEL